MEINTDDILSITEASHRGLSRLVAEAAAGRERVLVRHGKAIAAVVSIERLAEMQELEAALRDVTLVAARMLTDDGQRISLDEVLARFGYTRAELREMPD